jgi:pyruvate dehydrogenase complex dehydrogenase (E1) component
VKTKRERPSASSTSEADLDALDAIQRRVLWLAVRMIDAANRERPSTDGIKVGGHQASSASMVSLMTALYFAHLKAADRVSVKPHASPVFHAINYLLGRLDRGHLTRLRSFGGLQAYPSRTKDPDPVDFSTGSVGLGATAPLCAAATRRYVDAHFGPRRRSRFVALIGDAELDEGNIWEALLDPALAGLGNVLWVVDLNRQSLDRVVPASRSGACSPPSRAQGGTFSRSGTGGGSRPPSSGPAATPSDTASTRCPMTSTRRSSASTPRPSAEPSSSGTTTFNGHWRRTPTTS